MRLVDNDGKAFARQLADLPGDDRKFLQGRDDDRLASFERFFELTRGRVDVLDNAQCLLELAHRRLQLAVEHAPVGDDDDRVEDAVVSCVVQGREPMREPGDREALATAGRVLDQIARAGAVRARVLDEPPNAIELLIAREDQKAFPGLAPSVVLLLDLVDELPHEVEHTVARPGLLPQIGGGITRPRQRHRRIARTAEPPAIERQEARVRPVEMRRDIDEVRVDREMREAAAIGKDRLTRVALRLVLADRVLDLLAGQWIFEFGGEDRDAVQEQHEVEALLVLRAVAELPDNGEEVSGVQPLRLLIKPARRTKIGELELDARVPEAVPQHVECAAPFDLGRKPSHEPFLDRGAVMLAEPSPFLRLGRQHEIDHVTGDET